MWIGVRPFQQVGSKFLDPAMIDFGDGTRIWLGGLNELSSHDPLRFRGKDAAARPEKKLEPSGAGVFVFVRDRRNPEQETG